MAIGFPIVKIKLFRGPYKEHS